MTNIVMLSHGRLSLLKQTLTSLTEHTDPTQYNLTIVSDEEDDFRVTQRLRTHCLYRRETTSLLEVGNSSHVLSQLKNLGVAWSEQRFGRGDWLYLSDSDVWFAPDWLRTMTEMAAAFTEFKLWGGQIHPFHDKPDGKYEVLDGPSWLMSWRIWDMCGPFLRENAPGVCQSEEYPFCKLLAGNGRIGVVEPHVVEHTGITQTDGKLAPGWDVRLANGREGILYE